MTVQEAIEAIKMAQAQIEWEYPLDYAAAFDMAIKALKKQVPQMVQFERTTFWDIEQKQLTCPACDCYLTRTDFTGEGEKITYCENCGQKLELE